MKEKQAVYESIALDMARRIADGEFADGEKIAGRTRLASEYGTSPETIRKAMVLLDNANVVAMSQGKEIVILSPKLAGEFVNHYTEMQSAYSLRQELEILLEKKNEIDKRFDEVAAQIMRYTDRLRNLQPFNPVEIRVGDTAPVVGKTIADLKFRQRTGSTIIAIRRGIEVLISPESQTVLKAGDRLVVIGKNVSLKNMGKIVNE